MQNWYKYINDKTDYILDEIKSHPFISDLMEGILTKEIFKFYIHQDALYLAEYKKVLAILGTRCDEQDETQFFLNAATGIIDVEKALHQHFMDKENNRHEPSPTCEFYTNYLANMVSTHSLQEGLAAVLPCFTIYKQIGDYILENQSNFKNNPYQDWINTYGGDEFAKSVALAIDITNKYAAEANDKTIHQMNLAYEKASKLEWMFWDSAYQLESWKI
ncbi:thiaminase II [Flavobacteriaceae bacterium Ap0902]|nr:thiaminase II [Flavobacteriaceae bacterium Ap0902]